MIVNYKKIIFASEQTNTKKRRTENKFMEINRGFPFRGTINFFGNNMQKAGKTLKLCEND